MQCFYHGTSSALGITTALLPPEKTERLAELGRKRNLDKVFFTRDAKSAEIYAKKAVKRFGGKPVVLLVAPTGAIDIVQDTPGTTVLMADGGVVMATTPVLTPMRAAA